MKMRKGFLKNSDKYSLGGIAFNKSLPRNLVRSSLPKALGMSANPAKEDILDTKKPLASSNDLGFVQLQTL